MLRYAGVGVEKARRIALVGNDSLGNFVVMTPLAQMVRAEHPDAEIVYFCGPRVGELSEVSPLFDRVVNLFGPEPREVFGVLGSELPFDWVINIERSAHSLAATAILAGESGYVTGPCVGSDGRGELAAEDTEEGRLSEDMNWISADLTQKYSCLQSGFIGEIFARLAYLKGELPKYSLVSADPGDVPDVLLATAASLTSKLWPLENWVRLVKDLAAEGRTVGLLGAKPSEQSRYWHGGDAEGQLVEMAPIEDLRGKYSLPQVVGALDKAKTVVTLDNGILHFACATSTPTIGLFRNGIHRLWAPPAENLCVLEPGEGGKVAQIGVENVWDSLRNFQMRLTQF